MRFVGLNLRLLLLLLLLLVLVSRSVEPHAISDQVQYRRIDFRSWSLVGPIISRSEATEVDVPQRVMYFQLLPLLFKLV